MALLATRRLESWYGDFQALFGVDIEIAPGEIVALVGANGAGKSTFLKTVCGLLRAPPEAVAFAGEPIGGLLPWEIARRGIALVPEGRRLFPSLSVEENLLLGGCGGRPGPWSLAEVYALFPPLKDRRGHPSSDLSGGEQQMVALGRALMSNPLLLLCDELSLGLAPVAVKAMYEALARVCGEGLTALVVEQDVGVAQRISRRLYCMQEGHIALSGLSGELTREQISQAYFGAPRC